jgi:hypothetical protein
VTPPGRGTPSRRQLIAPGRIPIQAIAASLEAEPAADEGI